MTDYTYTAEAVGRLLATAEAAKEYITAYLDCQSSRLDRDRAVHDLAELEAAIRNVQCPTPAMRMSDALKRLAPQAGLVGLDEMDLMAMRQILDTAVEAEMLI